MAIVLNVEGPIGPATRDFLVRSLETAAERSAQEREFELERTVGFQAIKHQRFVGAGYFDQVQMTVTGGDVSTSALKGSTEEEQFYSGAEKKKET